MEKFQVEQTPEAFRQNRLEGVYSTDRVERLIESVFWGAIILSMVFVLILSVPTKSKAQGFPPEFELSPLREVNGGDGNRGFVLFKPTPHAFLGLPVKSAGDINGDGLTDIVFTANDKLGGYP